jgi:hypothetical protein
MPRHQAMSHFWNETRWKLKNATAAFKEEEGSGRSRLSEMTKEIEVLKKFKKNE